MKQTRKIRNKKLFLKWLKKSHRNKHSIVHSGGEEKGKQANDSSQELTRDKKGSNIMTRSNAVLLAGAVTLGQVAYTLASNPVVINAVLALGTGTAVFAGVASGGATVVLALVAFCVCLKVKELYSKYYVMVHVINDYMLLLQKIDTMVRVAIKLSQQYKFVIDTRDVNKSLERIFNKLDKLLTKRDIEDISNQAKTNTDLVSSVKVSGEYELLSSGDGSGEDIEMPKDAVERQEGKLERLKKFFSSVKQDAKEFVKVVKLNSKEFSEELNDEVTRLGLYFSILLGELNIILNISQMDMIGKQDNTKLIQLNTAVKSDDNFKNLLISSIIYRTLQLYNIFELCKDSKSSSSTKKTCSDASIKTYIDEIEAERKKINIVLFGKSNNRNEKLFPLYAPSSNPEKNDPNSGLERLRTIMRKFNETIQNKTEAQKFLDEIKKFNDELKKPNGKLGSSSETSTSDITEGNYTIDYNEAEEEPEPSTKIDEKPVPQLPPVPQNRPFVNKQPVNQAVTKSEQKPRQQDDVEDYDGHASKRGRVNQYQGEKDAIKYYDKKHDYDGAHSRFGRQGINQHLKI